MPVECVRPMPASLPAARGPGTVSTGVQRQTVVQVEALGAQQSQEGSQPHSPSQDQIQFTCPLCLREKAYQGTAASVACFGWCSAPFIYASLSEAVARYFHSRDIPVLTWIDDFYVTNFRSTRFLEPNQQFVAAQAAASLVLDVLYQEGYFISISKCEFTPSTRLVFLGIICDTAQCRFEAPADKLEKLEHILSDAISSGAITFQILEKLAGKCTSLSVAVPVAALYTHHMYKQIANFQRTGGRHRSTAISIPKNSGLMLEMEKWLEVRKELNGAS